MQTLTPAIERVIDAADYLGESPLWSAADQTLYWINCQPQARLQAWHPASGQRRQWELPERIGAVALLDSDSLLVALAAGVFRLDKTSGARTPVAAMPDTAQSLLHEGKCDRQGRFWIGSIGKRVMSHGEPVDGHIYRLDGEQLLPQIGNISVANGLAWSPAGDVMYFTDTLVNTLWCCDYDTDSGALGPRREFAPAPVAGGYDGAAVDVDGCYWSCLYGAGRLRRFTPDGRIDRDIELPFSRPTMLAFGGAGYSTLYLTTTCHGSARPTYAREAELGGVFALEGVGQGLPESAWRGY